MDQRWYYEDHGRAKGPVSTQELVARIQKGEMTLVDLVFREGEPQWMPAQSFAEITELIGNITLNQASDWIVLKTVNVDGKNINEQIGPFNAQQILDLLDRGKIRFSDYVWRTGYEKWVPLGRVDQFETPLKSSVEVDKSLYTKPRHFDLLAAEAAPEVPLKKVTIAAPAPASPAPIVSDDKPAEAKGEDLAAPKWRVAPQVRTQIVDEKSPPRAEKKQPPTPVKKAEPVKQEEPAIVEKTVFATTPVAAPAKKEAPKAQAPRVEKKAEAKKLPPLPETAPSQPSPPEEKFPIFDAEPLELENKKPLRGSATPVPPLAPVKAEVKTAQAPAPVPLTKIETSKEPVEFKGNVQKIKSGDAPPAKPAAVAAVPIVKPAEATAAKEKKPESDTETKKTDASESLEGDVSPAKTKFDPRWLRAGAGAAMMVLLCAVALIVFKGKKKTEDTGGEFSIKFTPPSKETEAQIAASKPAAAAPTVAFKPPEASETASVKTPETGSEKTPPPAVAADTEEGADTAGQATNASMDKTKNYSTSPTIGGSFKNRSYYHHKERIFLFYTSSEGEQLANDLQKASKKHQKSSKNWKNFYNGWKGKSKNYASKVSKEARKARLHRSLFKQLATSATQMDDLGRDLNAQISQGRGPSKVASAKSLETQFKSINSNARALDR